MADIAALIAAGKGREARIAISEARRGLELSGAEARALGKQADEVIAASSKPRPMTRGKKGS